MKKQKSQKSKNVLKFRTRHKPTQEHKDKSKYSRKGKWDMRTGLGKHKNRQED
ncbi:MAG: hypothetical protein IPM57_07220 [Oligoflexia bacterium]|nr:hypothetical protein [Oligoflexia bacterium]